VAKDNGTADTAWREDEEELEDEEENRIDGFKNHNSASFFLVFQFFLVFLPKRCPQFRTS